MADAPVYNADEERGVRDQKVPPPPPRYSTFVAEERREASACAIFTLLTIIALSGACLAGQTDNSAWFQQDVVIGLSNQDTYWITLGSYDTRFGWKDFCYRIGSSDWTCTSFKALGSSAGIDTDGLQTVGKMSYAANAVSVAAAGIMLLGLIVSMGKRSGRPARSGMGCLAALVAMYYFAVPVVTFPVLASNALDDMDLASRVSISWAYCLSLVVFILWIVMGCMHV